MNKKILIVLVLAIMTLCAVLAISCGRTTVPQTTIAEPVLDTVVLTRKASSYTDTDNTICLEIVEGQCETVIVTLNFTNTSNLAIYSVEINTVEYGKAQFKSATPQKVQIEVSPLFNTAGEYTIAVNAVYYSTSTSVVEIKNYNMVSVPVRVAPVFRMTVDMSATVLTGDARIEIYDDVPFMGYLDNLYPENTMNGSSMAPEGYAFEGWYASATPDISKDKSYKELNEFDFYTDMTFYAVYNPIYSYNITSGYATVTGLTKLGKSQSSLSLPETIDGFTIKEIGSDAFAGSSISSIGCNDSLRTIGSRAFKGCTSLRSISFNDNLTEIKSEAFSGCTSLSSLSLFPDSLLSLGTKAFEYCGWDTKIANTMHSKTLFLPETLTNIGTYCFQYSKFKTVYFVNRESEYVVPVSYGEGMFYNSSVLEKVQTAVAYNSSGAIVSITGTVSGAPAIPAKSFEYCPLLKTVTLAEGLKSIGTEAFMCVSGTMTKFTSLTLPDSLETIGSYGFGNVPLTSLEFASENGSKLTSIGNYAFQETNLSGSVILKTPMLVSYGASPFYSSTDITAIFLNTTYVPSFKTANTNAVQTLNNRIKYFVPLSLLSYYKNEWEVEFSVGGYVSNTVTLNIYAQEYITEDKNIAYDIQSIDGTQAAVITNFFDIGGTTLVIPDVITVGTTLYDVKKIGPYVASEYVTRVEFTSPQNIIYIDDYAFCYSSRLRAFCAAEGSNTSRFEMLTNLYSIGKEAFKGTAIDNFRAPDSLREINDYAFAYTQSLTKVFIFGDHNGNNGIMVMTSAFQYCGADTVVLGKRTTAIFSLAFSDCANLVYFVMEHETQPAYGSGTVLFGILGTNPPASCRMYLTPTFYQYIINNNLKFYKDYSKVMGAWNYTTGSANTL